ncbi:tRNA-dihydrouridine synthase [Candidatus Dependentiae bacterium]|nr:tRNA-dihydrouridine synthase [Candidatus Dependentiae bacterium]
MNKKLTLMSAPIDGVLDSPARQLIRQFSPDELLFGEMRHVNSISNNGRSKCMDYNPIEQPLAFQVSANSTDRIEIVVEAIIKNKFSMLNLNASCPAKNVIKSGSGSALMANPTLLREILLMLHKSVAGRVPLTIKIRAGYKEKNALDIAKLAQDCGITMVIIHPRTQPGGFSTPLDFDLVSEIKKSLSIPIIFSGELHSFRDIQETYEKTGADGFMIGRALWGAPWKMHEIRCQESGEPFNISPQDVVQLAIKHLELSVSFYGPGGVQSFKSHLVRYLKGFEHANTLRRELLLIQNYIDMKSALEKLALD